MLLSYFFKIPFRESEMRKLKKEGKCAVIRKGESQELQWEQCINQLAKTLDQFCLGYGMTMVKEAFYSFNNNN